jgi:hypothetical protein
VWDVSVSGYRVLPRWLQARQGMEIDSTFIPQMRDVAGRINELLFLFREADAILDRTLEAPLLRSALHLDESPDDAEDDRPD